MKKLASILTLAVLAATSASAEGYNARDNSPASHLIGEVLQVPAVDVVISDDFVNADKVAVTLVETSGNAPVTSAR
ncbi:hypothetical protein [Falsigemmobacter faecalis]|uniref:Uncharacterized protein n=1 Tax=Falsigemmobacter faecalis TaxID=2488730 RepID=A0A3P3DSN4_9RHOB|nr:hypothetical protein [Falsigemmobacter faecalis]RRH77239.1 hypothetical protein EG244_03290 [Falsigemmobacter faecalis]